MGVLDNVISGAATGAAAGAPTGIGLPVGAIIGAGAGLIGGIINNNQQKKATEQQMQNQKELGAYQQQLQEQTWKDTGAKALKQQYEEAGLNPALIYGSGAGGSTGTTGGGITTSIDRTPITDFGQRIISGAETGQAAELQKATETKLSGVDTAKVAAEIPKIQSETKGQDITNIIQGVKADIDTTMEPTMKLQITADLEKTNNEIQQIEASAQGSDIDNTIKRAAQQTIISKYNAELDNLIADTVQKTAQTSLTNAEARRVTQEILQKWKDINLHQTAVGLEHGDRLKMMTTILEAAGINAAGNVANTILGIQKAKLPSVTTRTQGFDAQGNPATVIQNNVKQ
nr:MAG: DNA pilot protein [Microviridae sp.]